MKDITKRINEAVEKATVSTSPNFVQEAVNQILCEEEIASGKTVAIIDDPIQGMHGAKGKVRGESSKGSGFWDVELENGTTIPCQASLLVPV